LAERQEAAGGGLVWAYPAWRDVFECDLRNGPGRSELKQNQKSRNLGNRIDATQIVELFEFRVGSAMSAAGPLTHEFNRPARMGRDQRIDKVAPHGPQTGGRPGLVNTHERE
jgi:hypothetical protein